MEQNRIVESFDSFIQQAGLAQTGSPQLMGKNPKKKPVKKSKIKHKSKQSVK